jgi:hypothetical protein
MGLHLTPALCARDPKVRPVPPSNRGRAWTLHGVPWLRSRVYVSEITLRARVSWFNTTWRYVLVVGRVLA